jgi:hypothetical protein
MTVSRQLRHRSANAARLALVLIALALLVGPSANAQSSRRTKKSQLGISPALVAGVINDTLTVLSYELAK